MGIPNVPSLFQKIARGSEGGAEFARVVTLLIEAESRDSEEVTIITSDAMGDFRGVDLIRHRRGHPSTFFAGYQFKFYPQSLTPSHRSEIKDSFESARSRNPYMHSWILVTPEDFLKKDMSWLQTLLDQSKDQTISLEIGGTFWIEPFSLEHWGKSKILSLMLRYPHVGRPYFPELYRDAEGKLFIERISVESKSCFWKLHPESPTFFVPLTFDEISNLKKKGNGSHQKMTSDPVFDIQLINNSNNVYLLKGIEIVRTNVWSKLSGLSPERVLKSIGRVQMKVDFKNSAIKHMLDDPLILSSKSPLRFGLQFKDVRAPGNRVSFYFRFLLSEEQFLDSKEYTLAL